MSAESEINAALNGSASLTAVVGDRIYPDFLAQKIDLPGLVFQREATDYVVTIHDSSVQGSMVTMEVWCLAVSRERAEALAELVEAAIAQSNFRPVDRRPEFNPDNLTFSSVVSCQGWPA